MSDAENYEKLRRELKTLISQRRAISNQLQTLEDEIYVEESAYLLEASAGNVIKGFEHFSRNNQARKRAGLTPEERLFSKSSGVNIELQEQ